MKHKTVAVKGVHEMHSHNHACEHKIGTGMVLIIVL